MLLSQTVATSIPSKIECIPFAEPVESLFWVAKPFFLIYKPFRWAARRKTKFPNSDMMFLLKRGDSIQ